MCKTPSTVIRGQRIPTNILFCLFSVQRSNFHRCKYRLQPRIFIQNGSRLQQRSLRDTLRTQMFYLPRGFYQKHINMSCKIQWNKYNKIPPVKTSKVKPMKILFFGEKFERKKNQLLADRTCMRNHYVFFFLFFFFLCDKSLEFLHTLVITCVNHQMSQLMRLWYVSHRRPAKAQASLRGCQSLRCSHT